MVSEDKRPKCPKCGSPLELCVTVTAHWCKKIKKDGSLYKVTNYSIGKPTDVLFLSCLKYGCSFHYNVSDTPPVQYPELNSWIDEHYEEIRF